MLTGLSHASLIVRDQDEALKWFTEKMDLELRVDERIGDTFRWVTVGVKGQNNLEIILHPPMSDNQEAQVGKQAPGVFATTDCRGDVERFRERGVTVTREPEEVPWGIQAMFEDLYGNTFVLVQAPSSS